MSEYIVDVRESERDGEPFSYLIWKDELIRCRDCRYYVYVVDCCARNMLAAKGDDFCSHAEPKEENHE